MDFFSHHVSSIWHYENFGTPASPNWKLDTTNYFDIRQPIPSAPAFADIDNDNDLNFFPGIYDPEIIFYENTGVNSNPQFDSTGSTEINFNPEGNIVFRPALVDIDADGDLDLIIGERDGGINFFRNDGLVGINEPRKENQPDDFKLYQNYPNPFNPVTTIQYQLPTPSKVTIEIYNILGQRVKMLVDGRQAGRLLPGKMERPNQAGHQVGSGVYIYRFTALALDGSEQFHRLKKMILLR